MADIALRECAMLWDLPNSPVRRADEVAMRGGWLNGSWTKTLFRRIAWDQSIESVRCGIRQSRVPRGLPIEAFLALDENAPSPRWECVEGVGFDMSGLPVPSQTIGMRNATDRVVIGSVRKDLYRILPATNRTMIIRADYWVSRMDVSFWNRHIDPNAQFTDRVRAENLWAADIWSIMADNDLHERPPKVEGGPPVKIDLQSSDWRMRKEQDPDTLRLRYRNVRLQLDAYENALPLCPSFDQVLCTHQTLPRQIEIAAVPIGGICDGKMKMRTAENHQINQVDEGWAGIFSNDR